MLIGAHAIIYSTKPDADREFLRQVLKLPHVDVGHGWAIFGLPPAEIAVHPGEKNGAQELYLMCDDIEAFVAEMSAHNMVCGPIQNQGWGMLTQLTLPGGGTLGVYQPRHARPEPMTAATPAKKSARRIAKQPPKKSTKRAVKKVARGRTKKGAR
jgi:hypothetical protein